MKFSLFTVRGAVIGPLVICGLVADENSEIELKRIGVKDSKELTPKKREELAEKIEQMVEHTIVIRVPACNIDSYRKRGVNLNQLEAIKMADIANIVNPDVVIVDAPSNDGSPKFRNYLISKLDNKKVKLICENFADRNYPIVSAASIVAKVDRDLRIKEIEKEFGEPIGVGYSHDKNTIGFLEKYAKENNGKMPKHVRMTWDTTRQITEKYKQKGVMGFLNKIIKKKS